MAQTIARFGETFGIRFLHRGSGTESYAKVHSRPTRCIFMTAFLVSTLVVGLAEIGDKTQILSLMLAARLQRPVPIIFGILFATLANHAAAGLAGVFFGSLLAGPWMRWILGLSFLSVAAWALFPDKCEGDKLVGRSGAFTTTLFAFFFAEIGDKTQIATVGLAAHFEALYCVISGTTLGMMLANIPAVLLGKRIANRLPAKAIRITAAVVFAALSIITLSGVRL
jgi:Ca2+/H+ antiporter, TMEM165/GDT1 family